MIFSSKAPEDSNWGPIADLMSGLMVVFLFIAVVYMLNVKEEKDKIEEIAVTYNRLQAELYNDLLNEFKGDLGKWGAEIDDQLSIRFQEPDILFGVGSSSIRPRFREILNDFFPRYINILYSEKYVGDIEEIRIEGHTSSEWQHQTSEMQAYFSNMELSQNRTRAVLEHVLTTIEFDQSKKNWIKSMTTANGLSSSRPIFREGEEDKSQSRRVEFRVRTNAEAQMIKILSAGR